VTGANGFIGTHVVRALLGRQVVAIARSGSDTSALDALGLVPVRAELDDEETLAELLQGCDAVVHLAGGGLSSPRRTWRLNAEGTGHVLAACRRAGVGRFLLASTVTVTRTRVAAYGASKREAERQALASGLDVTVFRLAFVYGPDRTGVFGRLVRLAGSLPVVPVIGSGRLDIAPVYVDDVVSAIVAALDRPHTGGKIYTLAGPPATFDDVVQGTLERLGQRKRALHVPSPVALVLARVLERLPGAPITRDNVLGMTQEADHDSSLARVDLGFSPRPLSEGLDATFGSPTPQS
jgi:nucleoside-diphosphate-sugar epimerase